MGDLSDIVKRKMELIESKTLNDRTFLDSLAKEVVYRIRYRTKQGYGVKEFGGKKYKFAPLDEEYKKVRKKIQLASDTTANKSNLTQTGEMLDNITYDTLNGRIEIAVNNSQQDKVDGNADKGRVFLNVSNLDITFIKEYISNKVSELLKKL